MASIREPAYRRGPYKRQLVCKNGHLMRGDNVYISPEGYRKCRACKRGWQAEYREGHPGRYWERSKQGDVTLSGRGAMTDSDLVAELSQRLAEIENDIAVMHDLANAYDMVIAHMENVEPPPKREVNFDDNLIVRLKTPPPHPVEKTISSPEETDTGKKKGKADVGKPLDSKAVIHEQWKKKPHRSA